MSEGQGGALIDMSEQRRLRGRGYAKGEKMVGDRPLSAKTCTDTQEVKISEWRGKCMYDDAHICMHVQMRQRV